MLDIIKSSYAFFVTYFDWNYRKTDWTNISYFLPFCLVLPPEIAALGFTCLALVSSQLSFTVSNRTGWIEFGLPAKAEKYLNLTYFLSACCVLENSRFIFSVWILGIICMPLMVSTFRLSAKAQTEFCYYIFSAKIQHF